MIESSQRSDHQFPSFVPDVLLSNDFDVGLDQDIGLADLYRWKVSAYAPCSSTCTTGNCYPVIKARKFNQMRSKYDFSLEFQPKN